MRMNMMLLVNGESHPLAENATVAELLADFAVHPQRVAVEVNEKLVRRAVFSETRLREGDRVEIVTLVGGG
jgi:sulfur carrier protein